MRLWALRLAGPLVLAPLAVAACGSSTGLPSDPYEATCQQWQQAGAIKPQGSGFGVADTLPSGSDDPVGRAFLHLTTDLHDGHLSPWGDAKGRKVSSDEERYRIAFQVARLCSGKNPPNKPGSLAVVYARRSLNKQEDEGLKNAANEPSYSPPPDQGGNGGGGGGAGGGGGGGGGGGTTGGGTTGGGTTGGGTTGGGTTGGGTTGGGTTGGGTSGQ
jgi:hypothetical protein